MWILPKQLHTSHYVQDMEGLISDLNEQSQTYAQSVLVKSKHSPLRTWCQKWKRDTWTQHLYGRILKPSHGKSFVESWILSRGVFPANHLVQQEKEMQTQTNDTCFPISSKELENVNQVSSSWKMLKESSVPNCQETDGVTQQEHQFCSMSSENWKEWVTKQRQEFSQRVKSEHLIREKESLSWGTPNTMDCLPSRSYEAMKRQAVNGGRKNRQRPGNLREQVDPLMCQAYQEASVEANWPTMTAMEADKAGYYDKGQMGQSLSAMANRGELSWPTARTSDAEGGAIETEMTQEGFRSKRHNSNQFFGAKLRDAVETHEKLCGPQDQDNHNLDGNRQESWPTPIAGDWKGQKRSEGEPSMLCGVVEKHQKWATPAAYDWNVPETKEAWQKRADEQKEKGVNLHLPLKSQVIHQSTKQPSMRLNPRWVETLQGLPVGWCLPSCTQPVTPEMMSYDYSGTE